MLIPTLKGGGAERVFVNLANFFANKDYDVFLINSDKGDYFNEVASNVKVITLNVPKVNVLGKKLGAKISFLFFLLKVTRTLTKINPNVLFCTSDLANIVGYYSRRLFLKKTKLIVRQARPVLESNTRNSMSKLLKLAFFDADLIIANSPDTEKSIREFFNGDSLPIKTIGNPVYDHSIISLGSGKPHRWIADKQKYILSVASLWEKKDHATLIRAFKKVREQHTVNLIVLGEGPLKESLQKLVLELGLEDYVDFVGFTENPYPFYLNAEIFVLSSLYEGFGNVIIEALAFGTPVVSTNCVGGPTYILENGKYGDLVPVRNPDAMAQALIYRLDHLDEMGSDILVNRAKDFALDSIGAQYLETIVRLINEK